MTGILGGERFSGVTELNFDYYWRNWRCTLPNDAWIILLVSSTKTPWLRGLEAVEAWTSENWSSGASPGRYWVVLDHYTLLGNSPPAQLLSQHFAPGEK